MKTIAVINYKGGVGKTSIVANLGAELAFRGKKVLLIDADAQASLTFSMIEPDDWKKKYAVGKTIKAWFDSQISNETASLSDLVNTPSRVNRLISGSGRLDVIYSHLGLINVDLELATQLAATSLKQGKQNFLKVHRRLAEGLAEPAFEDYEVILIDCPPNFNIVTRTAIVASDHILIPARPDYLSTLGIDYLMRSVNQLVRDYNEYAQLDDGLSTEKINPIALGVVFTMIQEYKKAPIANQQPFIDQTKKLPGIKIFECYIKRNDTMFAAAPQYGVPVVMKGYSPGTYKDVVEGIESFVTEFSSRLGI